MQGSGSFLLINLRLVFVFANQPSDPISSSASSSASSLAKQSARLRLRLWLISSSVGAIAWALFLAQLYHFVGDRLPQGDQVAMTELMRDRFLLCFAFTAPLLGALAYFAVLLIVGQRQELEEVKAQLAQARTSGSSSPTRSEPKSPTNTSEPRITELAPELAHPPSDPLASLQSQLLPLLSRAYRTPLTVILSSNELIEHYGDGWSKARIHRHLKRIRESVKLMTSLLNDALILVGQSETGLLQFEPVVLNLNQFVTDLVASLSANDSTELSVKAIPCRITCKLLPEAISVQGDPKLLRSILRNLLVNALTYSPPETQVNLVLTYDKTEATFLIQDQGMGIPAADQDHVFKPFFRAENAKIKTGAGLGLAIAKTCTELHGGNITLISTPEGTCVTVRLPMPIPTEALERDLQL